MRARRDVPHFPNSDISTEFRSTSTSFTWIRSRSNGRRKQTISEGVPVLLSRTSGLAQAIEMRLPTVPRSYAIDVQDGPEPTARQIVRRLLAPDAEQDAHGLRDAMIQAVA